MRYRIAHTIDAFEPAAWDALVDNNLSMTHRWQRMIESSWHDHAARYIFFEDARGPAGVVVASTTAKFGREGWRETVLKRASLVVSAPYSAIHCGISLRPDLSLGEMVPHIQRALAGLCWRNQRVIFAISNVWPEDLPHWQRHGFSASLQPGSSILDLPVTSYEEYLARLPGKDRAEIRRIRRRADEWGVTFEHSLLADEAEVAEIYPLVCQVYARHGYTTDNIPFNEHVFKTMAREMRGKIMLFKGFVNGKLEGVLICMIGEGVLWWPLAGLNYVVSRPTYLYFLLMDEMIRWAIAQGITRIYGGLTNEREKRGHGFYVQERYFCFRAHPSPLNAIFTKVLPWLRRLIGGPSEHQASDPIVGQDGSIRPTSTVGGSKH